MSETFEREWQSWAAQCVREDVTPLTRETLRCTFFAGAITWERLMLRIRLATDCGDATAARQVLALHEELLAYAEALIARSGGQSGDEVKGNGK